MEFGLTTVGGVVWSGVRCDVRGLEDGRLDVALIYSRSPCTAAGVFTTNRMAAAPVLLGREQLGEEKRYHGVLINSGNANACTGRQGMEDARLMRRLAAERVGCDETALFVCSTGRIGRLLPMEKLEDGIRRAALGLGCTEAHGLMAADAILTSDTRRKVVSRRIRVGGRIVSIAGMAKGAGMIEPNMATMLAFIVTDAAVEGSVLQGLLEESVSGSFNAITVDGDSSTNDTVLVFANGEAGVTLCPNGSGWDLFREAFADVCMELARKIVGDGEKITKVVEIVVEGAASVADARRAARAVGNSLLVKASWYGEDPNWGRLVDAVGYSGAVVSQDSIAVHYGLEGQPWVSVFAAGEVHLDNKPLWEAIVRERQFRVKIDLGQGQDAFRLWATDLTEGYVHFNRSE
jgi:glutamate N-acetyltransferase/amino-acid N-acetyltransferase